MNFVCVKDFENHAYNVLPKNALDYYKSGAGLETTLNNNEKAFSRLRIRPRCLRNVSKRDLSTTILGSKISMPLGIAPTAMQKMAHPEGEMANARAAEYYETIFIQSTISTSSIEEVAEAAPNAIKWFQLYIYNDREVTLGLIKRAEKAGFKAIVLTVDTPFFGIRFADMKNQFTLPPHLRLANFGGEKATKINSTKDGVSGLNNYVNNLFDASLTWKDVAWLKSVTSLPIVLKGILTAEDATIAADMGIAGILVSNHGARQVDGTPASIEALPEIAYAVGNRVEIYLDGGVRDGTDVFKALALGARMVFMGRPALWGLAHSGEEGVKKVLNLIKTQLDSTLAISGCSSIGDIKKEHVVWDNYYCKL
ncbi:PREDICTED: peroxisomal (S)-2-hydroxy-acid oxidase [Nicrophorus vespilloides]|uniref:Peroxisomal (S)-2-hydroxy-acid oxidase n=1 Tax=Nicrophorus vespilloides TaxID=110193 RepID=A0ABM1M2B4_NICVS|nr:PREDICTED: peroxisomal (S)-2-hydroxy-acid oxidase [Nicrophorus vespilloides]